MSALHTLTTFFVRCECRTVLSRRKERGRKEGEERKDEGSEKIHFKFRGGVQYLLFGAFSQTRKGKKTSPKTVVELLNVSVSVTSLRRTVQVVFTAISGDLMVYLPYVVPESLRHFASVCVASLFFQFGPLGVGLALWPVSRWAVRL